MTASVHCVKHQYTIANTVNGSTATIIIAAVIYRMYVSVNYEVVLFCLKYILLRIFSKCIW